MRVLALFLIGWIPWSAAATAQTPTSATLAAVGVLVREGKPDCSGVLVAPDTVLTAAHCIAGHKFPVDGGTANVLFRTGAYPGRPATEWQAVGRTLHPLFVGAAGHGSAVNGTDIALLHLASEVPDGTARPLSVGGPAEEGETLIIATYPGGQGPRARERSCAVERSGRMSMRLLCRAKPGESGGAALRKTPDGPELVGVMVAAGADGRQPFSVAVHVARRIGQLRAISGF